MCPITLRLSPLTHHHDSHGTARDRRNNLWSPTLSAYTPLSLTHPVNTTKHFNSITIQSRPNSRQATPTSASRAYVEPSATPGLAPQSSPQSITMALAMPPLRSRLQRRRDPALSRRRPHILLRRTDTHGKPRRRLLEQRAGRHEHAQTPTSAEPDRELPSPVRLHGLGQV